MAPDIVQSFLRWFHIVFGILWIGLLYFFNWVNSAFAPTLDAESKKKVVPELMPRALFWFRWGAAWTWLTGVLLLGLVFYHGKMVLAEPNMSFGVSTAVMLLITFFGFAIYDTLMKTVGKTNIKAAVIIGFLLIVAVIWAFNFWAHFSYRAVQIHVGAMFGTIMAFNVWFRIWPSQQKIITATKNGQAPDAAVVALAGLRSKHNTYLSIPLVWTMINVHTTWSAQHWLFLPAMILMGWWIANMCYRKAPKVKGF